MASVWGKAWGKAWGNSWGVISSEQADVVAGGGYFGAKHKRRKHEDEQYPAFHPWIHFPREAPKVPTEVADEIIEVVESVAKERKFVDEKIDVALAEREFKEWLKKHRAEYITAYSELIMLEYNRQRIEYEESQIVMLLFEM